MTLNTLPPLELSTAAIRELSLGAIATPAPKPDYAPLFDFPSGNVKIRVSYKGKEVIGHVISQVMVLASPIWTKFLFPPWVPESAVGATKEVDFREDNGEALLVLLRIVHLQFCKVPIKLSVECLYHIALLCEQYDCHSSIKPLLKDWMSVQPKPKYPGSVYWVGSAAWLYIAWTFGYAEIFENMARSMLWNGTGDLLYRCQSISYSKIVFPEKILEHIIATRQNVMKQLVALPEKALEALLDASKSRVQCKRGSEECDKLIYGDIALSLEDLKRQAKAPGYTAAEIFESVHFLKIRHGRYPQYRTTQGREFIHRECLFEDIFQAATDVFKNVPKLALDCHARHMERRAAQLAIRN